MPIMTRMRDSMPVILFGLLIAFLVTIIFEWGMDYLGMRGAHGEVIGKVNGTKISYKDFSEAVKNVSDNQKAQTGNEPDETQLKQVREQVWQSIVTQHLLEEEIARLGLSVADQEIRDWVYGDNPPDELQKNKSFIDSTGQFRKDWLDQFLQDPNRYIRDPRGVDQNFGTRYLAEYEKSLRQRRLQEKLQSLILASVRVTELDLRHRFTDQLQQYDALYALFDANTLVPDVDIQLSDADLKSYYEENLDQYKFEATRKLKYILLKEAPSSSDSANVRNEIEDAANKARKGIDFLQLVYTYAEKPDSGAFFKHGELGAGIEEAVFSGKVGDVIGPIYDNNGAHLFKILEERKSGQEYIRASHILFQLEGEKDTNAVKESARKILNEARSGKDFAQLARQYSKDPGSAQRGGDLGWFTKGRMVAAFENAAFKAKPGEIVGPVRSPFGLHIIKVVAKDSRELKVANIRQTFTSSSQTKTDLADRAKDFTYNARENDFAKEAQSIGFDVKETQVQEKGGVVPGVGVNESITRWAFNNKVGSVSEPFTLPNGSVVLTVIEAKDAGVRSLDEVKESIRPLALRKKKIEKTKGMAADLRNKLAATDSLWKISQLNPSVKVQRTGQFSLGGSIPGLGRDQNFIGAVSALAVGQISPPVQGTRGAFLIQLLFKTPFDSTGYTARKETLREQLMQEKKNRFLTEWLQKLKENADIVDNRDVFYR